MRIFRKHGWQYDTADRLVRTEVVPERERVRADHAPEAEVPRRGGQTGFQAGRMLARIRAVRTRRGLRFEWRSLREHTRDTYGYA